MPAQPASKIDNNNKKKKKKKKKKNNTEVISTAPYFTNKGDQTALYKIKTNVYIKASKGV